MTISEVSKQFDLSADTLRYYERIGLLPVIQKNSSGNRDYSEEDLKIIDFVKCMRNASLPINVLIEYMELFRKGDSTIEQRKQILQEQKQDLEQKIIDMQIIAQRLDTKINNYENKLLKREKELIKKIVS